MPWIWVQEDCGPCVCDVNGWVQTLRCICYQPHWVCILLTEESQLVPHGQVIKFAEITIKSDFWNCINHNVLFALALASHFPKMISVQHSLFMKYSPICAKAMQLLWIFHLKVWTFVSLRRWASQHRRSHTCQLCLWCRMLFQMSGWASLASKLWPTP